MTRWTAEDVRKIRLDGEWYEDADARWAGLHVNYEDLIGSFGIVLVQEDSDDYQGDTFALLLGDDKRLGFLVFGWGSCSGCDALQACNTNAEVAELRNELMDSIRWFESVYEAAQFFLNHDFAGDWHANSPVMAKFRARVMEYLASKA
jgi:hypothetical protein